MSYDTRSLLLFFKGMQLKFASDDGAELENTKEEDTLLSSQKLKTADDYFIINCEHSILQFYNGMKLQKGFDKKPRILDMCFVKLHNETHLVYIDADNKSIVVRGISKETELRKEKLAHEPNRLAKINNTTVGVIYKKELHILIFDVCKMESMFTYSITQGSIVECEGSIQGILALSPTELILSDKIHLYRCYLSQQSGIAEVFDFASSLKDKFDTARRLTQVTVSGSGCQNVIFVADENDKKLTSIGQTENLIDDHIGQNRGLQNVRAIGATEQRVYAATSAGISVFCHDKGYFNKIDDEDYRMIVEYKKHVEHTRGLCIHLDKDFIYIGLSCVIKQDDVVLVFKFKPNDTFK
ncbi:unnamed protein product [Mytilus coruscus]|uniref:Uncharacterized protein n=1 Tax=Mytilus coruscus TaxID=42192 RepID=A0A6J8EES5_MYTCO|nr:unnamed protein product [Mytilus coruscus]